MDAPWGEVMHMPLIDVACDIRLAWAQRCFPWHTQVELCMDAPRGEVLVGNILMEAKALERKLTSTEAQFTLDRLVDTDWLAYDKRRYRCT
jgi:hypothetical protein